MNALALYCTNTATGALEVREHSLGAVAPGHVRVRVQAAGVNFADTLMVRGKYQVRAEPPFVPGLEGAGVVECVGDGVDDVFAGTRVAFVVDSGAFSTVVDVPRFMIVVVPDSVDLAVAAAVPVAYGTSHLALTHRASLGRGEWLLVHGASGGVGLTAVEIGTRIGATVIATGGSDEKLATAAEYGADHCVNYRTEDVRDRVKAITGGRGVDVVYDPVGGPMFDASLRCAAWEARLVVIRVCGRRNPEDSGESLAG